MQRTSPSCSRAQGRGGGGVQERTTTARRSGGKGSSTADGRHGGAIRESCGGDRVGCGGGPRLRGEETGESHPTRARSSLRALDIVSKSFRACETVSSSFPLSPH